MAVSVQMLLKNSSFSLSEACYKKSEEIHGRRCEKVHARVRIHTRTLQAIAAFFNRPARAILEARGRVFVHVRR